MRSLGFALAFLVLLALACGSVTPPPPTPDVGVLVAQTMTAYTHEAEATQVVQTLEALQTQVAASSTTPLSVPPAVTSTAEPAPTVAALPSSTMREEFPPDPLPAAYTGVTLQNGECFDFDSGQVFASANSQCDIWLVEPALIRQQNGARVSGYVTSTPPGRSACLGARYEPGDLAMQTDLYFCFITNAGQPGFLVPTHYQGGIPPTGIVFNYWVFR